MSQAGEYHYIMETAGIFSINPLYPPILGDFVSWGTPPDPRQEVSCTSFSAVSVNYPPACWGASGARILAPSSLEFALQCLKTLLATPPTIRPASNLTGILANFCKMLFSETDLRGDER